MQARASACALMTSLASAMDLQLWELKKTADSSSRSLLGMTSCGVLGKLPKNGRDHAVPAR